MNILFLYPTMFYPQRGGVERVTDLLTREFIRRGHNVFYLHTKKDNNLCNYDYPAEYNFFPDGHKNSESNRNFLKEFLLQKKIDIIINQTGAFVDSALFLSYNDNKRIKTISVIHTDPLLNYNHLYTELFHLRNDSFLESIKRAARVVFYYYIKYKYIKSIKNHYNWLINNTDRICFLSKNYIEKIKNLDISLAKKESKIVSIPNPTVNCNIENINLKKDKILLYVGRLNYNQKRPDRILKIWKKLYKKFPDWKLVFVGDGEEKNTLEQIAKRMERVSFVGYKEPYEFYKTSSILCMTSNYEGWPMVLLESMGLGCIPIVYDSFGSITDIIDNGKNGVIVKAFKRGDYIYKLTELMKNENKRKLMSIECINKSLIFNIKNIATQWETLFNNI